MAAPGFGLPRSEGATTSLSAPMISTAPTSPRTDEVVNPKTVAIKHMIVMMGRLEASMNEVVKAVKPPPLRPDPAPPFGRQESALTQQQGSLDPHHHLYRNNSPAKPTSARRRLVWAAICHGFHLLPDEPSENFRAAASSAKSGFYTVCRKP